MVRSAVEVRYIENAPRRRVCFSKRKRGLKKKAYELSVLCNADVGVIVFSDTGRLYEFSSSSMSKILRRYKGAAMNEPSAPPTHQALPDMSQLVAQQEEEIMRLNQKLIRLKEENMSMRRDLDELTSTDPSLYNEINNMETALSLSPPLTARAQMQNRGSGSNNPANRMAM